MDFSKQEIISIIHSSKISWVMKLNTFEQYYSKIPIFSRVPRNVAYDLNLTINQLEMYKELSRFVKNYPDLTKIYTLNEVRLLIKDFNIYGEEVFKQRLKYKIAKQLSPLQRKERQTLIEELNARKIKESSEDVTSESSDEDNNKI